MTCQATNTEMASKMLPAELSPAGMCAGRMVSSLIKMATKIPVDRQVTILL